MSKKENVGNNRDGFFATRGFGFWAYLIALALVICVSLIYAFAFQSVDLIRYYSQNVIIIPLIAAAVSLVIALIRPLSQWASLVIFMADVYAVCQFFNASYLYLSSNFFGGVTLQAIMGMNLAYLICVLLYVIILIVSIISIFARNEKKLNKEA